MADERGQWESTEPAEPRPHDQALDLSGFALSWDADTPAPGPPPAAIGSEGGPVVWGPAGPDQMQAVAALEKARSGTEQERTVVEEASAERRRREAALARATKAKVERREA